MNRLIFLLFNFFSVNNLLVICFFGLMFDIFIYDTFFINTLFFLFLYFLNHKIVSKNLFAYIFQGWFNLFLALLFYAIISNHFSMIKNYYNHQKKLYLSKS